LHLLLVLPSSLLLSVAQQQQPPPPPWSQLFGLTGFPGNLPASNYSVSLGRVAVAGGRNITGRVLEQGAPHMGMIQAQGLTAFDSSRGTLLALLENGPFLSGHQVHLVRWSAKTGAVIDSCVAPMLPDQWVGAGQYLAVDEVENRALMIGRDGMYGAGQAWLWTHNLDGNNCSASTAQKLGAALPVAPGVNLALSFSALDQAAGVFWVQLPLKDNATTGQEATDDASPGRSNDITPTRIVGFDSHTGLLLHKLKLSGPGLQNPAFLAYDSGQRRVVGLGITMDDSTHKRTGSELFALDSGGGPAITIRKDPLPDSVVNVLSAVGTVDAQKRVLYFTCYIAGNRSTGHDATSGNRRSSYAGENVDSAAAGEIPVMEAQANGAVTRCCRIDPNNSSSSMTIATAVSVGASHGVSAGETVMTGLCAINVDTGAFLFSEGVCNDQPKCPWSLEYWD
jgi:hypothetical protein